jgi:hypothetical protein
MTIRNELDTLRTLAKRLVEATLPAALCQARGALAGAAPQRAAGGVHVARAPPLRDFLLDRGGLAAQDRADLRGSLQPASYDGPLRASVPVRWPWPVMDAIAGEIFEAAPRRGDVSAKAVKPARTPAV